MKFNMVFNNGLFIITLIGVPPNTFVPVVGSAETFNSLIIISAVVLSLQLGISQTRRCGKVVVIIGEIAWELIKFVTVLKHRIVGTCLLYTSDAADD